LAALIDTDDEEGQAALEDFIETNAANEEALEE
jgi:hypothetical protein